MSASPWRSLPIPLSHLSLPLLLRAGQSFRWLLTPPSPAAADAVHRQHAVFSLTLPDRVVQLAQPTEGEITYRHLLPLEPASNLRPGVVKPSLAATKSEPQAAAAQATISPSAAAAATAAATPDEAATAAWVADYFQLTVDSPGLWAEWRSIDPVFARRESQLLRGIRVLRMDVWECLFRCAASRSSVATAVTTRGLTDRHLWP
jgi:hypothetical protein